MIAAMRFGLPGGRGSLDPRDPLPTVEFARTADALGYDCLWFNEEHFSTDNTNPPRRRPSPMILAAAMAASTQRIRIGFSVLLPTLHNSVRLAEDIATLDVLSGGRVNLGVGWANDRYREVFRNPTELSLADTLDAMIEHWAGQPLLIDGVEHRVAPAPLQLPHPPIHVAAHSDDAIVWAAERGYAIVQSALQSPASLSHCLRLFAEHGGQVADAPVERFCFVAESDALAREQAWPLVLQLTERERKTSLDQQRNKIGGDSDLDPEHFFNDTAIIGSPETVARRVSRMRDELGIGFINVRPSFTGLTPLPQQQTTVALFASEVIPRLG